MKYIKEDLIELLSQAKQENFKNDFSLYLKILNDIVPDCLYRYCTHDNKNLDLITKEQMQLSNPNSYNDPYDSYVLNSRFGRRNRKYDVDRAILAIFQNENMQKLQSVLLQENILSSDISYAQKLEILKSVKDNYELGKKLKTV